MEKLVNQDLFELTTNKNGVWIIIPAFNEEKTISDILQSLSEIGYSIIVIDDCSSDNTCKIALQYPVVLLKHTINLGQGAALQTGFNYIRKFSKVSCVVTFDADGQHNIGDIELITKPILTGDYDVVLGSRFLQKKELGQNQGGIPLAKLVTLKLGVLFTRLTTKLRLTDTHNGFRAFSFQAMQLINISQDRMAHGSEILMQIAKNKMKYCEIPVTIAYTAYAKKRGQSVFNSLNILWDLFLGRDE